MTLTQAIIALGIISGAGLSIGVFLRCIEERYTMRASMLAYMAFIVSIALLLITPIGMPIHFTFSEKFKQLRIWQKILVFIISVPASVLIVKDLPKIYGQMWEAVAKADRDIRLIATKKKKNIRAPVKMHVLASFRISIGATFTERPVEAIVLRVAHAV